MADGQAAAAEKKKGGAAAASSGNAEAVDHVYPRLLMTARCGDSDELLKNLLLLEKHADVEAGSVSHLPRVTMEGDTLLHVVAGSHLPPACRRDDDDVDAGQQQQKLHRCVDVIVRNIEEKGGAAAVRQALEARNNKGDTPLHCAAGAGNAYMITCLVDLMANSRNVDEDEAELKKGFVGMQNECGETALHHAVRAPHTEACIDKLMEQPDLARVLHKDGTSPLYLAISLGKFEIAKHLYDLYSESNKGRKLSYSGPHGRNVLHAAVSCGEEVLSTVLEWLKNVEPRTAADDNDMPQQEEGNKGVAHHLLSELTSQRDKENGSTPLHLAASFFPSSGAGVLLDANVSTAYQPDKREMYPIHVAAGAGCLGAVEILLERCPECATLRDANGRTFLHVAVEGGQYKVVKYVCQQRRWHTAWSSLLSSILNNVVKYVCRQRRPHAAVSSLLSSILNAQDINGDTALHRAVYAGNMTIFSCLVRNQRVHLGVKNKEGMTPIDAAWSKMPLNHYYAWDSRIHIRKFLQRVRAPYGCETRGDIYKEKRVLPKQDEDEMAANLTAATQVLCIFSVLITTVTFASAFTLPGGYRSAGDGGGGGGVAGTAVLGGRSYAFDAFVLSDALAFICSLYATSLLLYAGVPGVGTLTNRFGNINLAYTLMWQAARCLVAAFALGLYLVLLPDDRTVAIAVVVLTIIIAIGFLKKSEGIIISMIVIRRKRVPSTGDWLLHWIVYTLDHFWSYIIIFGLPAIRKWARLP